MNELDHLRTIFPKWRHGAAGYRLSAGESEELNITGDALSHDGYRAVIVVAIHQRALRRNVRVFDPAGAKILDTPPKKGLSALDLLKEIETLDMTSVMRGFAAKRKREHPPS